MCPGTDQIHCEWKAAHCWTRGGGGNQAGEVYKGQAAPDRDQVQLWTGRVRACTVTVKAMDPGTGMTKTRAVNSVGSIVLQ